MLAGVGGQHGWAKLTQLTFGSELWRRLRLACRARSGRQTVWNRDQHGDWLDGAAARDRQRCSGPDGRPQAEGDFGGARSLVIATGQERRFHLARARCRTRRARPEGRLPLSVGVRPYRGTQLQKKAWWLANAIVPTWRGAAPSGQSIKTASNLSGWSSSTKPGPEPIWLP
jgi:hypothetical protein